MAPPSALASMRVLASLGKKRAAPPLVSLQSAGDRHGNASTKCWRPSERQTALGILFAHEQLLDRMSDFLSSRAELQFPKSHYQDGLLNTEASNEKLAKIYLANLLVILTSMFTIFVHALLKLLNSLEKLTRLTKDGYPLNLAKKEGLSTEATSF